MRKYWWLFSAVAAAGVVGGAGVLLAGQAIHFSSTPSFCMSCHEMRVVGEQGWMRSPHYRNDRGVVAECSDCHVPPDLVHMLWVKSRDGGKDLVVHFLGESDPHRMDWDELRETARRKVSDSSCRTCHRNLSARGLPISAILAHREKELLDRPKKCVACHRTEFHGGFRAHLAGPAGAEVKP